MLSYKLHRTITGEPVGLPVQASGRWRQSMTAVGNGVHEISLAGTPYSSAQWRAATGHWVRTLVCLRDGVPEYAGLIKRRRWFPGRKILQLHTVTVDQLFVDRYPFGVGSFAVDPHFTVSNASLASAVERAIYRVSGEFWGVEWDLPFRFHRLAEAGSFSKTWKKSDWQTASAIIATIRKMSGGPDLALQPFYDGSGLLRWDVLTGTPRIAGSTIDLPLSVRNSRAGGKSREVDEDGTSMASGVFARGEGFGDDRKVGLAGYFNGRPADAPEMLVRDVATNAGIKTDDQAVLDSQAKSYLDDRTWPTGVHAFDLNVGRRAGGDEFDVSRLRLGSRFNARSSGDEFEEAYSRLLYVVALSFDSSKPNTYVPEVIRL